MSSNIENFDERNFNDTPGSACFACFEAVLQSGQTVRCDAICRNEDIDKRAALSGMPVALFHSFFWIRTFSACFAASAPVLIILYTCSYSYVYRYNVKPFILLYCMLSCFEYITLPAFDDCKITLALTNMLLNRGLWIVQSFLLSTIVEI